MIKAQTLKVAQLISPTAIADDASWTSRVIDCAGFDYATVIFSIGVTDIAMTALKLQESNDNSSYVDITGADFSVNTNTDSTGTALALPSATDDNTNIVVNLDMRKRRRYIQAVATAGNGSAGTYMAANVFLTKAEKLPNTAAQQGAAIVVNV